MPTELGDEKWYLMAIDGLLIVRKVVKVIFEKEKRIIWRLGKGKNRMGFGG